jgi:cellobiose dehydrogenase (acceptor)
MTIAQYLGLGSQSRGRITIDPKMNMVISTTPWLHDSNDLAAAVQSMTNVVNVISKIKGVTMLFPKATQSVSDYFANYPTAMQIGERTANHWIGTAKMGTDDGRSMTNGKNGTAVVDTNAKVYGTDNLFVVDASIFPGITTGNPSSAIVSVAEMASQKILALPAPSVVSKYGQCGGNTYSGSAVCASGTTCTYSNAFYSQCL